MNFENFFRLAEQAGEAPPSLDCCLDPTSPRETEAAAGEASHGQALVKSKSWTQLVTKCFNAFETLILASDHIV